MLHLVYYLNCLANVEDVREQNRQAFELYKLGSGQQLDSPDEEDVPDENDTAEDLVEESQLL